MSDYGSPPPPPYGDGGVQDNPPQYPYGGNPYGSGGFQGTPPPPNYLVWAILSTIFCCQPLGIASIVFSTQVNSKWAMGDVAGAQDAANKARQFATWSVIAAAAVWVIVAVVFGIFFLTGAMIFSTTSHLPS